MKGDHSHRSRTQDGNCRSSYRVRGFRDVVVPIVNATNGQLHALVVDVTQHSVGTLVLVDASPVVGAICEIGGPNKLNKSL